MKRGLIFILLIATGAILTSSKYITAVSRQQQDFDVFKTVLNQKEGVLDLHTDKDSIQSYLNELKEELSSEKSLLEQYKLYSATLAKLGCGHTQIIATRKVQKEWLLERNSLPFDMYLVGQHLVVGDEDPEDLENIHEGKSNYEQSKKLEKGTEILSIDHRTIDEMMVEMGKYISSDENTMDFKYYQASQMFDFYRHLALPFKKDSIHIQYVTPEKDTNEMYFQPGAAPLYAMNNRLAEVSSAYFKAEDDHGKFKIVNDKYGYFRFKSFTSSSGREYEAFLKKSFREIKSKEIDKLVIDLRGNTGGVMQYSFMKYMVGADVKLGRYVIEKPNTPSNRKYISKVNIHYLRHTLMSNQQRRKVASGKFDNGTMRTEKVDRSLIYDGEIVVITDEGTFSSAAMLACHLKTLKKAKLAGRAPGGSFYAGNAGTLLVKLPQSGFKVAVNPNTFYSHLEKTDDPSAIKQPDLFLNPLILDLKEQNQFYFKQAISLFQ